MANVDPTDIAHEIESLKAHLLAREGRPDEALAQLDGRDDPESLFRRIAILMDHERYAEAADLIRGRAPHERWCEKAVGALAACGEFDKANTFIAWAHGQRDPNLWPSSLIALARGRSVRALRGRAENVPTLPGEFTPEESAGVRAALADLAPLVNALRSTHRITSGNEATAIALAMEFHYWLGELEEYRNLSDLLWTWRPIPIQFAVAVLRGALPAPNDLPQRLREERPESFDARHMAAAIEGEHLARPREAIVEAEKLAADGGSQESQHRVAKLLISLANHLPPPEAGPVRERALAMLGSDSRAAQLYAVEALVTDQRFAEAEALLLTLEDQSDPNWLQLAAAVREGRSDPQGAIDLLIQVTERLPHLEIIRQAATLAARHDRSEDAVRLFRRLIAAQPNDIPARGQLALLYVQTGEYEKAADQFSALRRLDPDEPAHGINEALSLARALRLEESLRVYDALCAGPTPPVEAIIGRAFLLKNMNRADQAFASLEAFRDAYWEHPGFVQAFTELGFASSREREASEGLARLQCLGAEGKAEGVLKAVTIDEFIRMMREFRANDDLLHQKMITGEVPWLLADERNRIPAYEGWKKRTKKVPWVFDDPVYRARHTIYATNGFAVIPSGDGRREAESLRASPRGGPVAIDLSALLTLHRLGILEKAADYFGRLYLPSDYRTQAYRESGQLIPAHQPSRRDASLAIKKALDQRTIRILEPGRELPFVHEHITDDQAAQSHVYGLAALSQTLKTTGRLDDDTLKQLDHLAHRPSGIDDAHRPLQLYEPISVHGSSLETLAQHGILDAVISAFQVHLVQEGEDQLNAALATWQERDEIHRWHKALWESINTDSRFEFVPVTPPEAFRIPDASDDPDNRTPWFPLLASFIAVERGLPLLVDERIAQMYVLNERADTTAAFGTDRLVAALLDSELLAADAAADAYLTLASWRYRFITVPPTILVKLARRSLRTPPGPALRQMARYDHDCLRDQGLFPGFEMTDPPVAMANRFFHTWASVSADFIMMIWGDDMFPTETANDLTQWAIAELFPSPPRSMGPNARLIAGLLPRIVLSQAFIRSASIRNPERANQGLKAISQGLGITDREYFRLFAEAIDAY